MNIRLRPIALGLLAVFGQPLSALAEQSLEPVFVTANRGPLLLEHATGETVVIGRQEIEARQTDRLTDIVNTTAGVFVSTGKGPLQTTPGFALRGIPPTAMPAASCSAASRPSRSSRRKSCSGRCPRCMAAMPWAAW